MYIVASPGLVSCRRRPLSSNVRRTRKSLLHTTAQRGHGPRTHPMIQHRTCQSRNETGLGTAHSLGLVCRACWAGRAFQQWWPRSGGIGGASAEQPPGKGGTAPVRASTWQRVRLTLRSRRGPTAGHQARSGGTRYIFASPGLASCRRSRLTSNVRHHKTRPVASPAGSAARSAESQAATARHSREQPARLVHFHGIGQQRTKQ